VPEVNPQDSLELRTLRTYDIDEQTREGVVRLCIDAHQEQDFLNLFSYLPPEGLHVLAYLDERLVGHAVVTIRWLQAGNGPLLRTPYADAVASSPTDQGRGIGSAVLRQFASVVVAWPAGRPVVGSVHSDAGRERHHDSPACPDTEPRSATIADDRGAP
jgi:hypothetical protein